MRLKTILTAVCILQTLASFAQDPVILYDRLDSLIVSAHVADHKTPVVHSSLNSVELLNTARDASVPEILDILPSVVATTEGGTGLGYSRISVRGSDASRTNVTLNGITINDAESQQVFWVNLPSLQNCLQSVELQRGIGTSSSGSGAFGASINMESTSVKDKKSIEANLSYGSFGSFTSNLAFSTGRKNGWGSNISVSYSSGNGYLRGGWSRLGSAFFTASKEEQKNKLTLVYLFGTQHTGITWNGVTAEQMAIDRRYNPAGRYIDSQGNEHFYENESDNYRQHHLQLHHKYILSKKANIITTLNYTRGDGYYENYRQRLLPNASLQDSVTRSLMGNDYWVAMTNFNYVSNRMRLEANLTTSIFKGNHYGRTIWCNSRTIPHTDRNNYENWASKADISAFVSIKYNFTNSLVGWSDIQYRHINYVLWGTDEYYNPGSILHYDFFNPKIGLMMNAGEISNIFASLSVGHKEPSRTDILETGDNLKPERMLDFEFGYRLSNEAVSFEGNVYLMEYKNQLVATGKISKDGYEIKENIAKSFRRGIELSATFRIARWISLSGNATFSINRAVGLGELSYSPPVVAFMQAELKPFKNFRATMSGKYVSRQFCDNLSTQENLLKEYFVMNSSFSYDYGCAQLRLDIGNMLNTKYISYGYAGGYYFPQPGTTVSFSVHIGL